MDNNAQSSASRRFAQGSSSPGRWRARPCRRIGAGGVSGTGRSSGRPPAARSARAAPSAVVMAMPRPLQPSGAISPGPSSNSRGSRPGVSAAVRCQAKSNVTGPKAGSKHERRRANGNFRRSSCDLSIGCPFGPERGS